MAPGNGFCAFIDLLGTKESANVHATTYEIGIDKFTKVVTSTAIELADSSHVHLFSDCAFITFRDFDSFARYVSNVRYQLFSASFFFKCAVVPGDLIPSTWRPADVQKREAARLARLVSGTTFSPVSVEAFSLQESFKGIGIIVDPKIAQPKYIIDTIFFKDDDFRTVSLGRDIRYSKHEIGDVCSDEDDSETGDGIETQSEPEEYIRSILSSVVSAKTKQRKYGRYYISMLVSLIKSSDFSGMEYDHSSGKWKNYPIIFRHLFINNFIEQTLGDVLGWEYCYLAAIGEYFGQQKRKRPTTRDALIIELAKRPRVAKKISTAPKTLILPEVREELLRDIAALTTKKLIRN